MDSGKSIGGIMIKRIKEYIEYRNNRKIVKKELLSIASATLPLINNFYSKGSNAVEFLIKLVDATQNTQGEKLIEITIKELSEMLKTDNQRIVEILSYMATLSPEDIQKIIIHSMVETGINDNKTS